MGMGFELLELTFDLRDAAGCGEDFPVGFRFPRSAAIAGHSDCFRTEVLGRRSVNTFGFQREARPCYSAASLVLPPKNRSSK